jgi:hypothetical protein
MGLGPSPKGENEVELPLDLTAFWCACVCVAFLRMAHVDLCILTTHMSRGTSTRWIDVETEVQHIAPALGSSCSSDGFTRHDVLRVLALRGVAADTCSQFTRWRTTHDLRHCMLCGLTPSHA